VGLGLNIFQKKKLEHFAVCDFQVVDKSAPPVMTKNIESKAHKNYAFLKSMCIKVSNEYLNTDVRKVQPA